MLRLLTFLLSLLVAHTALAATLRVPQDRQTIQAAVDAAQPGDTVLVSAGRYAERLRLRPGIVVRSAGDEAKGTVGLQRAETTILDGGGNSGDQPGVTMAEASTLDGFTITKVGVYDDKLWQRHYETHGEELADHEGAVQADSTVPGVSIRGLNCTVTNNIVHHNGDVGIAVVGGEDRRATPLVRNNVAYRNLGGGIGVADGAVPIVRENTCYENLRAGIGCRNSSPVILDNICYGNVRAGIGCREGARPLIRGNACYHNRRAGIGIRMKGTAPIVEGNKCYENDMAGIGSRDGAAPIVRDNQCFRNKMAGIGCDGSQPVVVGNECRENAMAGIGLRGQANAVIHNNQCVENKLVAIGVTQNSTAMISRNQLVRTGGVPPIVAVKDGSSATVLHNHIEGGGVAAVLIQGTVTVRDNRFRGSGEKQGNAVWVWAGSTAFVSDNEFTGYRAAVQSTKSEIIVTDNKVEGFTRSAIVIKDSTKPAHVFGNVALSDDPQASAVAIQGPAGVVAGNVVKQEANEKGSEP